MLADEDEPTPTAAADRVVAAVRDDPARRLRLAADFYNQRACGRDVQLCTDEYPTYAWPYERRHVWRTDRSPIAIAFIRAVVGRPAGADR